MFLRPSCDYIDVSRPLAWRHNRRVLQPFLYCISCSLFWKVSCLYIRCSLPPHLCRKYWSYQSILSDMVTSEALISPVIPSSNGFVSAQDSAFLPALDGRTYTACSSSQRVPEGVSCRLSAVRKMKHLLASIPSRKER